MFLCIENDGVCPIQGIDLLGASTARGTEKIGQFGTGLKHGFTLLLRIGWKAFAYFGDNKIEFFSKDEKVGDKVFSRVYYSVNGDKEHAHKLSWCTDFGAIDWTTPEMALREFVSNAIDQNGGNACLLNIVDKPEGKSDKTRIFVEYNATVRKYYAEIEKHFLHFADNHDIEQKFFPNEEPTGPSIYRKGVFVKTENPKLHGGEAPALFNYNLSDIAIDECRNLNNNTVTARIGRLICENKELFVGVFKAIVNGKDSWEYAKVTGWQLRFPYDKRATILGWWKEAFGDLRVTSNDNLMDYAEKKGILCAKMKESWAEVLHDCGVEGMKDVSPVIEAGMVEVPVTDDLTNNVNRIWATVLRLGLNNGKKKPKVKMYQKLQDGQSDLNGMCKNGIIYIHENSVNNFRTILHEIGHYITGAQDCSHDFAQFAYHIAAELIRGK